MPPLRPTCVRLRHGQRHNVPRKRSAPRHRRAQRRSGRTLSRASHRPVAAVV
jgi:hypothetical protein